MLFEKYYFKLRLVKKMALTVVLLSSLANPVLGMDVDPPEKNPNKRARSPEQQESRKHARTAPEEISLEDFIFRFQKAFLESQKRNQTPLSSKQETKEWEGFKEIITTRYNRLEPYYRDGIVTSNNAVPEIRNHWLIVKDIYNYFQEPDFIKGMILFDLPVARQIDNLHQYCESFQKACLYSRDAYLYAQNDEDQRKAWRDCSKLEDEWSAAMISFFGQHQKPNLKYFVLLKYCQAVLTRDTLSARKLTDFQAISTALNDFTPDNFLQSLEKDYAEWRVLVDAKRMLMVGNKKEIVDFQETQWGFKSALAQIFSELEKFHFFQTSQQKQRAADLQVAFGASEPTSKEQEERILKLVSPCYLETLPPEFLQSIGSELLTLESGSRDLPALQCTSKYFEKQVINCRKNTDLSFNPCPPFSIIQKLSFLFPDLQKLSIVEIPGAYSPEMSPNMCLSFEKLRGCTALTSLTLKPHQGCALLDTNLNFLHGLTHLKELSLGTVHSMDNGFLQGNVNLFWQNGALESLSLPKCGNLTMWLTKLNKSKLGQTLTSLNLENAYIANKRHLLLVCNMLKLKTLNLRGIDHLTDEIVWTLDKKDPSKNVRRTFVGFIGFDFSVNGFKVLSSALSSLQNLYLGGWGERIVWDQSCSKTEKVPANVASKYDLTPEHPDVRALPSHINVIWAEKDAFHPKEDPSKTVNCNEAWAIFRAEKTHALKTTGP